LQNAPEELRNKEGSFSFLRSLSTDIRGSRFQKDVMPFVVLTSKNDGDEQASMDSTVTTSCLENGAVDILHSPLRYEDINRMIGHFKEQNRPPARLTGAPMAQNLVDSIHNASKPPRSEIYRPDENISAERQAIVEDAVFRWHFPAQDFNMDELTYAVLIMLEHVLSAPELEAYCILRPKLVALLLSTRRQYKHEREVHYHNWRHAVDVAQCIFCFMLDLRLCPRPEGDDREDRTLTPLEKLLSPLDGLVLLVSAIGHDVGHPGVNNAFLVACNHPLAQTYNDRSVLENYHCAAWQQLLRRHWPALNDIAGFRATMISTILATDMQRHFEYMANLGDLRSKVQNDPASIEALKDKDRDSMRDLLMALLIKAADISNIARPFDIAAKWARILMYEFARQGELEAELGIPTCLFGGPPDTSNILAAAQSQQGFMNLFGLPLFQGITEILPALAPALRELERNEDFWRLKIEYEQRRRDSTDSQGHPHYSTVNEEVVEEAQHEREEREHRRSEPAAVPASAFRDPGAPAKRVKVESPEVSPTRHGAHESRLWARTGTSGDDGKRASAPASVLAAFLPVPGGQASPSRRSSKDLALDSVQGQNQSQAVAVGGRATGSRRGSADVSASGWQVNSAFSADKSSRRGSKDESLTAFLVTSGSSGGANGSVLAPSASTGLGRLSPPKSTSRSARPGSSSPLSKQPAASNPAITPPAALASLPTSADPFALRRSSGPLDLDGTSQLRSLEATNPTAAEAEGLVGSSPPPPPKLRVPGEDAGDVDGEGEISRVTTQGSDGDGLRQTRSRSRSRLAGLKFWRKRRDVTGVGTGSGSAADDGRSGSDPASGSS